MGEQIPLVALEQRPPNESAADPPIPIEQLKLRRPDRRQVVLRSIEVEHLVDARHRVRAIWELTGRLDPRPFATQLRTQKNLGGRSAWDPRLLVAIWIWAYSEAISSAREIERQCEHRPELQWLCGMEKINHHTLSDFRVSQSEALEGMFTNVLAVLSEANLIDLEQVTVDGTRVRSQGATSSRRRRGTIEKHLEQARGVVQELSAQADDEASNKRRQAARQRAARQRVERLAEALEQLQKMEAGKKEANKAEARASETEPEARLQRESNGGWAAGYNAQFATDAKEKIVVGVELTNNASDAQQLEPTLEDMQQRLEQKPRQVLADEGYNSRANIERMQAAEMEYATPAPQEGKRSRAAARAAGIQPEFETRFFIYDEKTDTFQCPANKELRLRGVTTKRKRRYRWYRQQSGECKGCEFRLQCCPTSYERGRTVSRAEEDALMAGHRAWMETERAKQAYRRRSEVAEFPNAWLKERFGVRKFRVRGLRKARSELLWAMLAYNVRVWIRLAWQPEGVFDAPAAGAV